MNCQEFITVYYTNFSNTKRTKFLSLVTTEERALPALCYVNDGLSDDDECLPRKMSNISANNESADTDCGAIGE